jgi:endonuclease-3
MASRETFEERKKRAGEILKQLKKRYPKATCALNWSTPLELLVATILSAQCTDERVNLLTKELFKKYPSAADYARADEAELQEDIRSAGFFRQKAKSIVNACGLIEENFGGKVPDTMEELLTLPGVARKTANVLLGTAYGKNEGIAVDTHVGRVALRLGLVNSTANSKDAVKIEKGLMELIPQKDWAFFSHAIILLGREICSARKPDHENCPLNTMCPSVNI